MPAGGEAVCPGREAVVMTTFVIVHGAWGGGWEWSDVVARVPARGHQAFAPTLTGRGERSHLAVAQRVGLSTDNARSGAGLALSRDRYPP